MFRDREILNRLDALEAKLDRIEQALAAREQTAQTELARKREQFDALAQQSLHVAELLNQARQEIERMKYSGGSGS